MKNQITHARLHVVLMRTLAGFMSAVSLFLYPAAPAFAQASGRWTFTGNLNEARSGPFVTRLADGRVLLAGGYHYDADSDTYVAFSSAELYDPTTGTWSFTGNLHGGHSTSTLLANGKVLAVGDFDTELYDPATGTWTRTGNPSLVFNGHREVPLQDGRLLMVGGFRSELYDPNTGTWSMTGSPRTARYNFTATALPNGKVLIAGGSNWFDYPPRSQNSAELYDPATGTWSYTGNLNTGREFHSATLLSTGKVLIAGGLICADSLCGYPPLKSTELYDPATGTWSYTGNLNTSGISLAIMPLGDGKAFIMGANSNPPSRPEVYDANTGSWSPVADPNRNRIGGALVTLANSTLLVAGGDFCNSDGCTLDPSVELFEISPVPGANTLQLNAASYRANEDGTHAEVFVNRPDTTGIATVDYTVSDAFTIDKSCRDILGIASSRCDYTTTGGTLHFAAGESAKTITIPVIDDTFVEGNETLTISLSNPTGVALGSPSAATITIVDNDTDANAANPYLDNAFFVRQQYLDFLLREPDSTGYYDWLNVLGECGPERGGLGAPVGCDRVHVSSGFFRSPEFGEKGYWVYRFFEGGLGRRPQFAEFMPEMRRLSGLITGAEQESRRADFIARFMQLPEFTSIYTGITDAAHASQFIAKLEEKARVTLPATTQTEPGQPTQYGRAQLINLMQTGSLTPAQTLRAFIEQKVVWDTYFYRAFVAMQYFGYLQRDPDAAGYNDWVDVLTNGRPSAGIAPGDYRHLIFGFIYSVEYRERFGKQ